jgi:hypothetical protein
MITTLFWVISSNLLPTFRDNLSVLDPLKVGRISRSETSVINYHYSLRNDLEESSCNLLCGRSLK